MVVGRSVGSCLMVGYVLVTVSAGDAGLAAASMEPRDATREGAGVDSLLWEYVSGALVAWETGGTYPSVQSCTSGRTTSEGRGPCSLR